MLNIEKIPSLFVICVVIALGFGLIEPIFLLWIKPYITILLGIIMFGMGLTLESADFKTVIQLRFKIIWIIVIKYLTMPAVAYILGYIFKLPHEQLIGLVLVSSCPGGTAAAVMSYLARANVVLTIVLTFITTLLSPILIPAIIYIFFHKHIQIDAAKMASTVFWIVVFPLLDGLILRRLLKQKAKYIQQYMPLVSMFAICLIIGCIVGLNRNLIMQFPILITSAVILNILIGVFIGYIVARLLFFKKDNHNNYAVAFEFGIQDSGLAVVLAIKFFGVVAALSGVLYSVCQNVIAAGLIRVLPSASNKS